VVEYKFFVGTVDSYRLLARDTPSIYDNFTQQSRCYTQPLLHNPSIAYYTIISEYGNQVIKIAFCETYLPLMQITFEDKIYLHVQDTN